MRRSDKTFFGFTQDFWILCAVVFSFFFSFNLIIPQLPDFLTSLKGERYKGLIIGAFAISALFSRPFSGKLIDHIGRRPIMLMGIMISIVVSFGYPLVNGVTSFLALRFLHGFSAGFTPTATTAMCSDVVPIHKRGEAMGIVGMAGNLGMSLGPALGSEVGVKYGNQTMFLVAGCIAIVSILPAMFMRESLPKTTRFNARMLRLKWVEIIEPKVVLQGTIMALSVVTFGALLTLVPDYAKQFGLERNGYFFTVVTVTSLTVRILSGKLSDKFGREIVLVVGLVFLITANIVLINAKDLQTFFIAGAIFGISTGINSPTLFAWTIDKGNQQFIGRGISTLFIFLEIGIIAGSIIPAEIYGNVPANIPKAFMFTLTCAVTAFALTIWAYLKTRKTQLESF
ncbi:MAG: MFS family permease [Bacteroidia bacterium]|jgi:MFS family permease